LFGRAPSGQNATGASDLENWNQQVASEQSLVLGPAIRKIYGWLLAQPDSPISKAPEDLKVIFPAVETPTRQELVNEYQQIGATDIGYITAGVVTPEKVALTRTEQPGFFPKVDKVLLRELEELRNERLLDPPEPAEMAPPPVEEELAVPAKDTQDELVFQRDGKTFIRSGDEEFEITGE
jgi:hypothetical protein